MNDDNIVAQCRAPRSTAAHTRLRQGLTRGCRRNLFAKDDIGGGVVTLSPYGASSSTATRSPFPSLGKATLAMLAYTQNVQASLATEILVSDVRSEREQEGVYLHT